MAKLVSHNITERRAHAEEVDVNGDLKGPAAEGGEA